jgi:hypothetical protein
LVGKDFNVTLIFKDSAFNNFWLSQWLTVGVNSTLGSLHCIDEGSSAASSALHKTSIFRVKVACIYSKSEFLNGMMSVNAVIIFKAISLLNDIPFDTFKVQTATTVNMIPTQ